MTAAIIVISSVRLAVLHHFSQQLCLVSSKYLFFFEFLCESWNMNSLMNSHQKTDSQWLCIFFRKIVRVCCSNSHLAPTVVFKKKTLRVKTVLIITYMWSDQFIPCFGENDEKQEKFQKYCSDSSESQINWSVWKQHRAFARLLIRFCLSLVYFLYFFQKFIWG